MKRISLLAGVLLVSGAAHAQLICKHDNTTWTLNARAGELAYKSISSDGEVDEENLDVYVKSVPLAQDFSRTTQANDDNRVIFYIIDELEKQSKSQLAGRLRQAREFTKYQYSERGSNNWIVHAKDKDGRMIAKVYFEIGMGRPFAQVCD